MTVAELIRRWATEAELLEGYGAAEAASATRRHAQELSEALRAADDEELTLEAAAKESGYSRRRLRELVASGDVPNAGRKGAPRIRRADLPRRPGSTTGHGFDARAHAAEVLG